LSTPKRRQSASSEAGEPGNFWRAISTVSVARAIGISGRPTLRNSWFRNFMSKGALWMTSCAAPMKARKAGPMAPNTGLSRRKSSPRPWTSKASFGIGRSGLMYW
jgi:hypothetical protein